MASPALVSTLYITVLKTKVLKATLWLSRPDRCRKLRKDRFPLFRCTPSKYQHGGMWIVTSLEHNEDSTVCPSRSHTGILSPFHMTVPMLFARLALEPTGQFTEWHISRTSRNHPVQCPRGQRTAVRCPSMCFLIPSLERNYHSRQADHSTQSQLQEKTLQAHTGISTKIFIYPFPCQRFLDGGFHAPSSLCPLGCASLQLWPADTLRGCICLGYRIPSCLGLHPNVY